MSPDDAPDDPLPAMIAGLDQALEMAGEVARVVHGHYQAFLAEGFTEKQALYAAVMWIKGTGEPPSG